MSNAMSESTAARAVNRVSRKRTVKKPTRVCVLTGASGYLGQQFIKKFSHLYRIVAVYNKTPLPEPQNFVDPLFPSDTFQEPPALAYKADLTKQVEINALVGTVINTFGKADLLVNAACHRNWSHIMNPGSLDYAEWSFSVNVMAPLRLSKAFATAFWHDKHEENIAENRNIINISSTAGTYVYPDSGQTLYSATKSALNYVGYHMANEFWHLGVRVNTVAPNTFPHIVSVYSVLDAIWKLDKSTETGQLVHIDKGD